MKKLLVITNAVQFRRIWGSMLVIAAGTLLYVAFWMTPVAKAQSPAASPDFDGANDPKKCTICHLPPGNPSNAQTLTIGCSAVDAHMRNHPGDCLGPCPCQPTAVQNP